MAVYLLSFGQTARHWRVECNRTRGVPMPVSEIPIPAATPAASNAIRPSLSESPSSVSSPAPSTFSAKLATSMSDTAPEHAPSPSTRTATAASPDATAGAKLATNIEAKFIPKVASNGGSSSSRNSSQVELLRLSLPNLGLPNLSSLNLNWLNLNSRSFGKTDVEPDAKPAAHPAPVPGTKTSLPTSVPTAIAPSLSTSLASGGLAAVFEKRGFSAPAANLADPSLSQQPFAPLTANLAGATAPPPLPIPQAVAVPAEMTKARAPLLSGATVSGTTVVPSPRLQPGPGALPTSNSSEVLAAASSAPAVNLPDSSSNRQPFAPLTANLASVTAPQPLPIPQTVAVPAGNSEPSTPLSSGTTASGTTASGTTIALSPQLQPCPAALPTSNSSEVPAAARPDKSGASSTPADSPVPTGASPKSSELTSATGQAASDSAYSSPSLPTQPSGALAPSSRASGPVPTSAATVALDQFANVQPPSVSAAPLTPAAQFMSATPLTKTAPSLPDRSSDRTVPSSGGDQGADPSDNSIPVSAAEPAFRVFSLPSSVSTPTPTPIPAPESPATDNNAALPIEPPNAKPPAAPKSSDAKVGNGRLGDPAVESAPASGSAAVDPAPDLALSLSAAITGTAAAQTVSAPETGFAIAHNFANNPSNNASYNTSNNNAAPSTPTLTPNSSAAAPIATSLAATTNETPGNGKPDGWVQPDSAAATRAAAGDKKSPAAAQPTPPSSQDTPANDAAAAIVSGRVPSPTLTAPAPSASAPPSQDASGPAAVLPKAHEMLDSAAPAAPAAPPAPIAPGSAADLQTNAQVNAQMHVGVRTDAFGSVEIHTVVQQSQVGITVHADRDIARWFSSEVPGLESGLNKNHLNLTAVNFDNGRSGVQTATGFQQGQPRQSFSQASFSQTTGSQSAGLPGAATLEQDMAAESATVDILPSGLSAGSGVNHVSIHV